MSKYEDFFPYVLPFVDGCSEPVMTMAVRDACIEFCDKSLYLTAKIDPIITVEGTADYDLEVEYCYRIARVVSVWADIPRELAPMPLDSYQHQYGRWTQDTAAPSGFYLQEPCTLTLFPTPDKAYTLDVTVAITPLRSSTSVECVLLERFAPVIADGALARLYMMEGQDFYDANAAQYRRRSFLVGVNGACIDRNKGLSRASARVIFDKRWAG
jgi:hypothetical protein